MHTKTIENIYM